MKKLLSLIILIFVLYGVSVFLLPGVATKIDILIWMPGLSDAIKGSKSTIDSTVTNIPSIKEFKSWAIDIKDKVVDWVEMTKETIDTIRSWAQKVEETYDTALDTYNNLKGSLEDAQEKVEQIGEVVDTISELTGSGN
jgi:methyl-accepting chemotaxis protein